MKAHRISPFCIVLLVVPFSKITSFPVWFWLVQVRIVENSLLNVIKSILFSETVFKINENSVFIRWISNIFSE